MCAYIYAIHSHIFFLTIQRVSCISWPSIPVVSPLVSPSSRNILLSINPMNPNRFDTDNTLFSGLESIFSFAKMLFEQKKKSRILSANQLLALFLINKCVPIRNEFLPGRAVDRRNACKIEPWLLPSETERMAGEKGESSVGAQALETDIEGSPAKSLDPWRSQTGPGHPKWVMDYFLLHAKFLSSRCRFQGGFWDLYLPCLGALWGFGPTF